MDESRLLQIELSLDRQITKVKRSIEIANIGTTSYFLLKVRLKDLENKLQQYLQQREAP